MSQKDDNSAAHDDLLMKKVARGESQAFHELFKKHGGHVLGYAMRYLKSKERAEDVTQEIWLKVVRLSPHYDGKGFFVAWIYTMTRNQCLNDLRSQSRLSFDKTADSMAEEISNLPSAQNIEAELLTKEDHAALKADLESLPDTQRAALLLHTVEELSYEDIASQLSTTVASVKSLIFRARQKLLTLRTSK